MTCGFCERQEPEYEVVLPADGVAPETKIETCSTCTQLVTEDDPQIVATPLAGRQ